MACLKLISKKFNQTGILKWTIENNNIHRQLGFCASLSTIRCELVINKLLCAIVLMPATTPGTPDQIQVKSFHWFSVFLTDNYFSLYLSLERVVAIDFGIFNRLQMKKEVLNSVVFFKMFFTL